MNRILITIIYLTTCPLLFAQQEGPDVRRGNKQYNDSNYVDAEVNYRRALNKNDQSFEAHYNLGDALFRQEKYAEALEQYVEAERLLKSDDDVRKGQMNKRLASTYHNMGNALYVQEQYDKAVAAYQQSLRRNPKDNDTRYNLVKAMQQLQQQQQEQNQQQDDQQQQQQQQQQQPKSTLFYSGTYTQTGKSINNMGQYNDTGAPALHQVKIYSDKIVVNNKEIALWKQHGDWYYYGQYDGEPIYMFNPKAFDLRWRFVFNFGGKQISDNFWVPGDQLALHTYGGYGRYPDSTRSTSVPVGRHRCERCDGAGDYPTTDGVPNFGRNNNQYCAKCGTVKPIHWHKPCESCKGQGWW